MQPFRLRGPRARHRHPEETQRILPRAALLLAVASFCGWWPAYGGPSDGPPFETPPRGFDFLHMRLEVTLTRADMRARRMPAVVTYRVRPRPPGGQGAETRPVGGSELRLNAVALEIQDVALGPRWRPASYQADGKHLTIELDRPYTRTEEFTLRIRYVAGPRQRGLYFVLPDDDEPWTPATEREISVYTMSEPLMARYWLPCHDWPDTRWPADVFITVPKPFAAVSVGEPVGEPTPTEKPPARDADPSRAVDELWTYHWRQRFPTDPHMLGFAVGRFVTLRFDPAQHAAGEDASRRRRPAVHAYVQPGREQVARATLRRVPDMLDYFATLTGVPYPLPQYSHVAVPRHFHGGMEHVGFSMISPGLLRAGARDSAGYNARVEGNYIAHMLAHQWFGGLVNYRDVKEAWLNEGPATYLHQLWRTRTDSYDAFVADMHATARRIARADRVGRGRPLVRDDLESPETVYSYDGAKIYWKGAWILHMLRHQLGDELFWQAVHAYLQEHRGGSVVTADLRRAFEQAGQRDLEPFFDQWVYRGGVPELDVSYRWDADAAQAAVEVVQQQTIDKRNPAFSFPLDLYFLVAGRPHTKTVRVSARSHTFTFAFDRAPTVFCVDPDAGLLKKLKQTKSPELWVAQLRRGPTALSRARAITHARVSGREPPVAQLGAVMANREEYWKVRKQAAEALAAADDPAALDYLLRATPPGAKDEPRVLSRLLRLIADLGARQTERRESATGHLVAWLSDARPALRAAAASGLARVGNQTAVAALRAVVEDDDDESVRQAARAAIEAIEQSAARDPVQQPGAKR